MTQISRTLGSWKVKLEYKSQSPESLHDMRREDEIKEEVTPDSPTPPSMKVTWPTTTPSPLHPSSPSTNHIHPTIQCVVYKLIAFDELILPFLEVFYSLILIKF